MIRNQLKTIIDDCFEEGVKKGLWSDGGRGRYAVEVPKRENQGDFSTNIAMVLAGLEKKIPVK